MDSLDYFSNYIFPALILIVGLIGNLIGFKTMQRPKMLEIGPRNTYKYLFIMDTIYLVQIIVSNLQLSYNIDITILSNISCKLWNYINYSLDSPSSMLLVYISLDRYVSFKMPANRYFMRKRNNQLIFFIFVIMCNLVYYLPVAYYYLLERKTNDTLASCQFMNEYTQNVVSNMDISIRGIIPISLTATFTTLLCIEIYKSRKRILVNFESEENKYHFKNINLAITSIFLNIINILVQMPLSVYYYLPNYSQINGFVFFFYLFYLSYSINFYAIFMFNYLFRNEAISFLKGFIKRIFRLQ